MSKQPSTRALVEVLVRRHSDAGGITPAHRSAAVVGGQRAVTQLKRHLPELKYENATVGQAPMSAILDEASANILVAYNDQSGRAVALLSMARSLVHDLATVLLGGAATASAVGISRPFVSLDARVAMHAMRIWNTAIVESFQEVGEILDLPNPVMVVDPGSDPPTVGDVPAVSMIFELKHRDTALKVVFAIMATRLRTTGPPSPADRAAFSPRTLEMMSDTMVSVNAVLDAAKLTVAEIGGLLSGDILALVDATATRVRVECAGEPMFWASLGRQGQHLAVKLDAGSDVDMTRDGANETQAEPAHDPLARVARDRHE